MKQLRNPGWIAIGTGIGAAFGAGNGMMAESVALGVAAGVLATMVFGRAPTNCAGQSHDQK